MTTTDATTTPAEEFVGRLEELGHRDQGRADLARLRRCAGRSLGECPETFQLFYRLLPYPVRDRDRDEELYFLVATLFALNPHSSGARDFGATMAALATSRGAGREGIDRRMAVLLDAPLEDLGFRLRQLVALAASSDVDRCSAISNGGTSPNAESSARGREATSVAGHRAVQRRLHRPQPSNPGSDRCSYRST
jgi:hypothetical protein